jgi:predicted Ser/Thr protein kinase
MDTMRICQQCRQPLPENAPEGLCPPCLAKVAQGSEPAAPGGTINVNPPAGLPRIAPDVAQVAAHFPQLEIIELLGIGGMGMVYKARQRHLDRLVALKILPVESAPHPSFAERFSREAKALAKLNYPGIVYVYDFGQSGPYYYFIMEYVDGMNLRQLLNKETVTPRQALELVVQICAALQYAHDEGIVHRDIKPENILLNKKGQVKIADFGLAKLLGAAPDTGLTMSQAAMGTINYMAPEQRQNAQGVDHRADIYSLGVVFYEMLTGEVPMGRFEPPSKRVQVDVRLDEVVLHALERDPARRYQQASEVKTDVENVTRVGNAERTASSPAPTVAAAPAAPVSSQPRLSRTALAGAACLVLLIVVLVFSLIFVFHNEPQYHTGLNASGVLVDTLPGPPTSYLIECLISVLLAVVAALGMPACGWLAVNQIRRSSGRIYGLPLALFDGLLFPLLAVNAVTAVIVFNITSDYAHEKVPNAGANGTVTLIIIVLWLLVALPLNFFIIRKIWRVCRRPSER